MLHSFSHSPSHSHIPPHPSIYSTLLHSFSHSPSHSYIPALTPTFSHSLFIPTFLHSLPDAMVSSYSDTLHSPRVRARSRIPAFTPAFSHSLFTRASLHSFPDALVLSCPNTLHSFHARARTSRAHVCARMPIRTRPAFTKPRHPNPTSLLQTATTRVKQLFSSLRLDPMFLIHTVTTRAKEKHSRD